MKLERRCTDCSVKAKTLVVVSFVGLAVLTVPQHISAQSVSDLSATTVAISDTNANPSPASKDVRIEAVESRQFGQPLTSKSAGEPSEMVPALFTSGDTVDLPLNIESSGLFWACVAVLVGALVFRFRASVLKGPPAGLSRKSNADHSAGLDMSAGVSRHLAAIQDLLENERRTQKIQVFFATEAAHELRTPLTAQRIVGELALRPETTNSELREALMSMLEESSHMQDLIDNLLLVARARGGMLGVPVTTVDAADICELAVHSMLPLADTKGQRLIIEKSGQHLIRAEGSLLRQVLLSLIHNGLSHTPEGSTIWVKVLTSQGNGVLISISDDGPGLPPYVPDQVVRRYARREGEKNGRGGLGLGLTIANSLVVAQGGKMVVGQRNGGGAVVDLYFERSFNPLTPTVPPSLRSSERRQRR